MNDLFGSGPSLPASSNNQPMQSSNNLNDLFGGLSTGPITTSASNSTLTASKPAANANIANKISSSSTWAGIDNLDSLVNMGPKQGQAKQSMNSMMSTKPAPAAAPQTSFASFPSTP